VRIASADSLQS